MSVAKWKLMLLATAMTSSMIGCGPRPVAGCASFEPIYLSEGAISALRPYRADREKIAAHNETYERLCPSP